jgi:AraC-like DNA-binding protein
MFYDINAQALNLIDYKRLFIDLTRHSCECDTNLTEYRIKRMSLTFFAPSLDVGVRLARGYGVDPLPILIESGIDLADLADFNARISSEKVHAFYTKLANKIPNPNFGLDAGKYWHPSQMGALGYAWMTSSTLRSAFERVVRFSRTVLGTVDVVIEESEMGLSLIFDFSNESFAPAFRLNGNRAIILAMIQCNAGRDFYPQAISFSHGKPENERDFNDLFQCPLIFNADVDSLTISLEEADKPRSCSNKQLAQLHDQVLITYLAKLDKNNIVENVKWAITESLSEGKCSDSVIASKLFMSQRTIQRRLKEKNTTFKNLINEVRQDLADTYLNDSSLTLTEISFMLGFSEASAFSRAFKRWAGQSPSDYRGVVR